MKEKDIIVKTTGLRRMFQSGTTEIVALKDLDLEVEKGQFVSITGKSGSGKSTLLYQLSLLDHPTAGDIYLEGKNMGKLTHQERTHFRLTELGYVFQDYAILPSLTTLENVLVPLLMKGLSSAKATEKALQALERVGLSDRINNTPSQLSGGQQQRVAIARAIAHEPKIIFADEPTANLDSDTSRVILDLFLDLNKDGQTIVMVTHEKEYAAETHRIVTLADGVMISDVKN